MVAQGVILSDPAPPAGSGLYVVNNQLATISDQAKRLYGLLGMAFDVGGGPNSTFTMVAATVYGIKIPLAGSGSSVVPITNVCMSLTGLAASTLTHSFAGVLTSAGVLVGMTADNSSANANWSSTGAIGFKSMPLVGGPFNVTPTGIDDFVFGVFYVGTSAGALPAWGAAAALTAPRANLGLSAAASRTWSQAVADTATPFAALTMASNVAFTQVTWMGIS